MTIVALAWLGLACENISRDSDEYILCDVISLLSYGCICLALVVVRVVALCLFLERSLVDLHAGAVQSVG